MRHAKAEPYASDDHGRQLTRRGREDAAAAGRYLASVGLVPDHALVSDAARTQATWEEVRDASGSTARADISSYLYDGTPHAVLEAVRALPDDASTVIFVGHNPTAAHVAHQLTDGEGDPEVVRGLLQGFPPAAVAVFEVAAGWADLAEGEGRLTHYHVGRG